MEKIDPRGNDIPQTREAIVKILEQTVEGIAIIRDDMTIEYINDRICEILDQTREEILNQSFLKFVHPDSSDHVAERFADRLAGEEIPFTYETRVLHGGSDSRILHVRTTVMENEEDKMKILAQVRDVTDERRTQCALSDYVMKYSTLVDTMNEGLGIIDDRGVVVYANTALCKMMDYIENELTGKSVAEIMQGYELNAVFDKIKERIAGRQSRYESQLVHRSGKMIPVMVSASPLLSDEGEYKGSFAIFTDITAQKRLKRDLETARDRALLYLDLMSHDLRNHLQEIQISAELLKYRAEDPSSHDFLERILQAISKSSGIISETKTIEELSELPLCERVLDEVLNETVMAAIVYFDDVEFQLSIQTSDARVMADAYLELLLSDLLSHACERCQEEKKQVWITLAEEEDAYRLVISNNGPALTGIEKKSLLNASRPSSGLRLQLARFIVEKYTGTIEVLNGGDGDSRQGSTTRVLLPRSA
jgi:PAS domain S-box-containing protein